MTYYDSGGELVFPKHDCPRVVTLTIDRMDPTLFEHWIGVSKLLNLQSFRNGGGYGSAECTSFPCVHRIGRQHHGDVQSRGVVTRRGAGYVRSCRRGRDRIVPDIGYANWSMINIGVRGV